MWARSSCRGRGGARAARGVAACRTVPPVPPTPRAREFLSRVLCLWNEHTALTRGVNSALRDAGQCPLRPGLTHAPRSALQVWIGDAWLSRTEAERAPRVTWASLVRLHLANTR